MKMTREELKASIIANLEKLSSAELNSLHIAICSHCKVSPKQTKPDKDGDWGCAHCDDCGTTVGEWCVSNPKNICEFQDDDHCKHCGKMDPWENQ